MTNTVVGNVADTRAFNGFGEIADYAVTASASSLYSATYTRDALGRVASQTETVGAATTEKVYDYDIRGRLTSVETDGVVTEWYAYDRNGNRTNSMNGAAVYDAQDRLLANASTTFAYDLNGSLTNRLPTAYSLQSTAFSYDLFGQLASATLPDGRAISYDRDALSRVTAKRIDGVIVRGWIYKDALKPIAETDASGNVVSFFVYGTSALSPDTMDKDGVTYRFIRDVQGSVRLVVDSATGLVAQRLDYDAFGNVLLDTNPGFQPFGFQSGLYDPDTALVQFGARWYDANTGRWLSKDPILLEGGLNLYVFCGNDPVNFTDPLGLSIYLGCNLGGGDGFSIDAEQAYYFNSGVNSITAGPNHSGSPSYGLFDGIHDTIVTAELLTVAAAGTASAGYGAYVAYGAVYPYVVSGSAALMASRPLQSAVNNLVNTTSHVGPWNNSVFVTETIMTPSIGQMWYSFQPYVAQFASGFAPGPYGGATPHGIPGWELAAYYLGGGVASMCGEGGGK